MVGGTTRFTNQEAEYYLQREIIDQPGNSMRPALWQWGRPRFVSILRKMPPQGYCVKQRFTAFAQPPTPFFPALTALRQREARGRGYRKELVFRAFRAKNKQKKLFLPLAAAQPRTLLNTPEGVEGSWVEMVSLPYGDEFL